MRNGGYKDFSKYTNGIQILYKKMKEQLPGFRLKIFIDTSTYTDADIMK